MANVDVTRIASNIGALNSLNALQNINSKLAMHQTRLSTGKRINSAADDPAGLTIATKMLARSEGLKVANDNISDAQNMMSVAEAGLSKMNDILVQMRNKAEQAASDTLGTKEREAIQTQLSAFAAQIDDIVDQTKWNGTKLIDGSVNGLTFQTGVEKDEYTSWSLTTAHDASTLGISAKGTGTETRTAVSGSVGTAVTDAWVTNGPTPVVSKTAQTTNGLSALAAGSYQINILAVANGDDKTADHSYLVTSDNSTNGDMTLTNAASFTGTDDQLASGDNYVLRIDTVSGAAADQTVNWSILDSAGNQVKNGSNHLMLGTATELQTTTGRVGVSLGKGAGNTVAAGDSFRFNYMRGGDMKYEMVDGGGNRVNIDKDGVADPNGTSSNGTVGFVTLDPAAANTIDTGRGLQFSVGRFDTVATTNYYKFNWSPVGENVVNVSTTALARDYMNTVSNAIDTVNGSMSSLGSLMARLTFKQDQVTTAQVNVESAYSRIMNANMAEEQMNASKYTILQQTATAMLAQANQAPQSLLSLFR